MIVYHIPHKSNLAPYGSIGKWCQLHNGAALHSFTTKNGNVIKCENKDILLKFKQDFDL